MISLSGRLILSIFTHMHLARIHPFYDGNGRLSRMVQNLILNYNHLPAIKIEVGERYFYKRLLRNALREFNERKNGEYTKCNSIKSFFEYLASIGNINLDRIESILKKRRTFEVIFDSKEKQKAISLEHKLKDAISAQIPNKGITARLNRDGKKIIVRGDISQQQIEGMLKYGKNHTSKIKCQVTPKKY